MDRYGCAVPARRTRHTDGAAFGRTREQPGSAGPGSGKAICAAAARRGPDGSAREPQVSQKSLSRAGCGPSGAETDGRGRCPVPRRGRHGNGVRAEQGAGRAAVTSGEKSGKNGERPRSGRIGGRAPPAGGPDDASGYERHAPATRKAGHSPDQTDIRSMTRRSGP
ncbi:hypothetical protein SSCG_00042 [Streptomyces clavuligerus]|nr:hypothetical protein SSCG_00042 [Streptomyces clavuligerus]